MPHLPASVHTLERELRGVFGARLQSLVAYGLHAAPHDGPQSARTLVLVESLTEQDLRACASRMSSWHGSGLATPLLIPSAEFGRSLDAFPLEFGAIIADHVVVVGDDPFERMRVEAADLRRACEIQARSHLLHLREGFLEARGNSHALAVLIVESAAALAALLLSVARLEGRADHDPEGAARHVERALGVTAGLSDIVKLIGVHEISAAEAERLFTAYLATVDRLVSYVDSWAAK